MRRKENPGDYIVRIMQERNLTYGQVAERAKAKGFQISPNYVHSLTRLEVQNLSIRNLKALAAGLDRPVGEVAAAFGLQLDPAPSPPTLALAPPVTTKQPTKRKAAKKKRKLVPKPKAVVVLPPEPLPKEQIGFVRGKKQK